MKAVIYARYSSDNQREESIDGQLRECMEYAKFNGIDVVNSYIDRALSARRISFRRSNNSRLYACNRGQGAVRESAANACQEQESPFAPQSRGRLPAHHKTFLRPLRCDNDWLTDSFPIPLAMVKSFLTKEPCDFPQDFSIENYSVCRREPTKILHDGQKIDLGGRTLLVVHTPGHSPGHCCFFEPERGYLFSGDLIYKGKLDAFYPTTDPMQFMHSIKKVKKLPVKKILPGHHSLDVPVDLIEKIGLAFKQLYAQNKLHHGSGIFDFEEFSLHI